MNHSPRLWIPSYHSLSWLSRKARAASSNIFPFFHSFPSVYGRHGWNQGKACVQWKFRPPNGIRHAQLPVCVLCSTKSHFCLQCFWIPFKENWIPCWRQGVVETPLPNHGIFHWNFKDHLKIPLSLAIHKHQRHKLNISRNKWISKLITKILSLMSCQSSKRLLSLFSHSWFVSTLENFAWFSNVPKFFRSFSGGAEPPVRPLWPFS